MTTEHVHRFYRLTLAGLGLTRWGCRCGIKTWDTAIVAKLEGTSL